MMKRIKAFLRLRQTAKQLDELRAHHESLLSRCLEAESKLDFLELSNVALFNRCKESENREMWLRAQLLQVRVRQSVLDRAGWEVMCFIPEEVLKSRDMQGLILQTARRLVEQAIKGIHRVDSMGKVCALVFAPLNTKDAPHAPEYVQAMFDKEGKFKMSEKCWDRSTEEERVRRAAGCGGFGV